MDIVEQLRKDARISDGDESIMILAADKIERLRWLVEFEKKHRNDAFDALDKQDAEIERLRGCVKDLLHYLDIAIERSETDLFGIYHNDTMDAIAKAEAALQQNGSNAPFNKRRLSDGYC